MWAFDWTMMVFDLFFIIHSRLSMWCWFEWLCFLIDCYCYFFLILVIFCCYLCDSDGDWFFYVWVNVCEHLSERWWCLIYFLFILDWVWFFIYLDWVCIVDLNDCKFRSIDIFLLILAIFYCYLCDSDSGWCFFHLSECMCALCACDCMMIMFDLFLYRF